MKNFVTFLVLILLGSFLAFGQSFAPPTDTLANGGTGHQMTFSMGDSWQGECDFACNPNRYKCWQMPPNMDTQIAVCGNVSPPFADIAVVITSDCRWITFASCQTIGDPIMAPFSMQAYIEENMQLCAFWNSNETDSVGAFIKGFTISAPELSIIGDMDTCGAVLAAITEPIKTHQLWEFDGKTWQQVTAMKPNRMYKESK